MADRTRGGPPKKSQKSKQTTEKNGRREKEAVKSKNKRKKEREGEHLIQGEKHSNLKRRVFFLRDDAPEERSNRDVMENIL